MGSRLLLSAIVALAAFGTSVAANAAEPTAGYHARAHRHYSARHNPRYHGRFVGGYRYWYQTTPFTFSDAENYPGHYDNQTFWERVETQRNYPVGY